jgi:polyisoprenoid-binding protein YceI
MKNLMILALAIMLAACGGPEGEKVEATDAVETPVATVEEASVMVDTDASIVNWVGAKLIGDQHTGTIRIAKGKLMTTGSELTGGMFVIDMTSMEVTDETPDAGKAELIGHLSTGDFFEVDKYNTATFEITGVAAVTGKEGVTHNITGNLTMKDVTKSITIPATVKMSESGISATTPQFTIDRTQWGVEYGSATAAGALKNKAINDEIALQINLATK